jgi:hypothetical protein
MSNHEFNYELNAREKSTGKRITDAGKEILTRFNIEFQNQNEVYGIQDLRFPSTLESDNNNTPMMVFVAKKWELPATSSHTKSVTKSEYKKTSNGSVALYLPSFSENTNIVWDETKSLETAAAQYAYETASNIIPFFSAIKDTVKLQNGISISQDSIATFSDIENRQFTFNFELVPTSHKDTTSIQEIIKYFRINSSPNFSDTIISFPAIFDVQIVGVKADYFRFLPMALTGMSVTYGDDTSQAMMLMQDDTPSSVRLELNFREIRKPYRDAFI